ncbi:MAG TPA: hypothetical protein DCS93_03445 [Microscillaceae bacterium]|nr:hypothetical protein [Microscillaceae bacterium]
MQTHAKTRALATVQVNTFGIPPAGARVPRVTIQENSITKSCTRIWAKLFVCKFPLYADTREDACASNGSGEYLRHSPSGAGLAKRNPVIQSLPKGDFEFFN